MLPIEEYLPDIIDALQSHNNLVLQAEPGAGKSTLVPLKLITANILAGKKVIMLEPRRVAVKSLTHYLATTLNETMGETVGYQIRNERKITKTTQLEIVTEGVLTRKIQNDPELKDVGLIIFDEFHERSIHADLALNLALEVQQAYRDDLKLLVMSATIDTQRIASYLDDAPVISCPGRSFAVTVEYAGQSNISLSQHVKNILTSAVIQHPQGDILVFLPGQAQIKQCISAVQQVLPSNIQLLPLYGGLPLAQQELVLKKASQRRVIFSTNIAETSLTIDGISLVIDSGLEKRMKFDVKSGLSRLDTTRISKASATQRAGRAGRTQAGHCIRLWPSSEQHNLDEFQSEEINITDLANLVLELFSWGITRYDDVNWLTAPPRHHFDVACALNTKLGLLKNGEKISTLGRKVLSLGVDARLGSMLLRSETASEKLTACLLAALLSERDILFNAASADINDRLLIIYDYLVAKNKPAPHVNVSTLKQVITLAQSFARTLHTSFKLDSFSFMALQQLVAPLLLKAYPDRLAKVRKQNSIDYLLANGRGVALQQHDALIGQDWLVVCDCDGKNSGGIIYSSAPITLAQINSSLADEYHSEVHYKLDSKKENIIARQISRYASLVIEEQKLNSVPDEQFKACIKDILHSQGLKYLHWTEQCENWLARCQWLQQNLDRFPNITEASLLAQLDTWLLPYISQVKTLKQLKSTAIYPLLIANLTWQQQQQLEQDAPLYYQTPSGSKVKIRYDEHQGPTVSVVLQEMFGQIESPTLAQGKVAIRFELLSPAKRPIQTTSDLGQFWHTSYFAVAKEMRGRYPKHRWPEQPLLEKPGRSIKAKNK